MDEGFSSSALFILSISSSALINDSVIADIMSVMIDIIIFFVERIVKLSKKAWIALRNE